MKIYKKISRKKWKTPLLLLLLLLAVVGSAKAQIPVMYDGTIYTKLDLQKVVTTNTENAGKLSNGEYDDEPWEAVPGGTGTDPYSYLNIDLGYPVQGKVMLRYDTYKDHAPTDIEILGTMNPDERLNWHSIVRDRNLTNQENTSRKVILDLDPALHGGQMYRYLQIRVRATSTTGDRQFKLNELDILVEADKGTQYNLNGKLGSSNLNGANLGNLYDENNENFWQSSWMLNGVVPGEYSNIKVDLGEPTTGYVFFNYSTREMQAPQEIAFYGYNGADWNDKYASFEETPVDINTKWDALSYVVDPDYDDDNATPWKLDDLRAQIIAHGDTIHTFTENQNNKTHHVVIALETPYRYIMMRVYEGTGNPNSAFQGHVGSTAGGSGPYENPDVIVRDVDRSGKGYMFNFDLRTLDVYKISSIPNKEKLMNLDFFPTNGVVDPENKDVWGYRNTNISETTWTDEGNFGENGTFDEISDKYGISKPDFNRQGANGQLQAAHEKEYDIYVIPGETVTLIPYSDIAEDIGNLAYHDGYVRWYDYENGRKIPEKYFGYEFNPVLAWDTKYGLFGSSTVINRLRNIAGVNQEIGRRDRYRASFTQFHAPAGEEFTSFKVAADFTTAAMKLNREDDWDAKADNMMRGDNDKIQIVEPPVTFRAVFNIKDGREFARKLTEDNFKYIEDTKKVVSAPSGRIFRIRLDFPEPKEEGVPSDIYYIKGYENGTPVYGHVYKFRVETDGVENGIFSTDNGRHDRGDQNNPNFIDVSLPRMGFVSEQTGKEFNRFLKCGYTNATTGKHIVRIYGCDENGEVIRTKTGEPLQIMEYEITFQESGVDVSMQSMTDYLKALEDGRTVNNNLYRHTSQSLTARFGEPYSKQDFDQYVGLEFAIGEANIEKYFTKYSTKTNIKYPGKMFVDEMGRAVSYPIAWDRADYAFSYATYAGWNVYDILNHSEMASYSNGAGWINKRGLFDVSFYFKHPKLYKDPVNNGENQSTNDPTFNYATHTYNDAGYFFYVDAAADPGRIYRSEINKPCPGTRIHVSAWVSEFGDSRPDPEEKQEGAEGGTGNWANVIFHLREQLSDGTIKTLYSYVPGKVPTYGDWYHIYFSFSPNVEDMDPDPNAKYYVVLESNCPSSWGADYAVDDIEIFIQKPDVSLMQFAPICKTKDDQGVGQLRLLVECPYDILVGAAGLEEDDDAYIYFATINKEKYDEEVAAGKETNEAFANSIVRINAGGDAPSRVGRMGFKVNYEGLPEFKTDDAVDQVAMKYVNEYNEECIRFFITIPDDKSLMIGSNLIFCLVADPEPKSVGDEISTSDLIDLLNFGDACSINTDLRLQGASIIKIDGVAASNQYDITVCENQRPVVQLVMQYKDEDGNVKESDVADQIYDWFDGTYAEFVSSGLEAALAGFRFHYPASETYDMPVKTEAPGFSEDDKALLKEYCDAEGDNGGRLHLSQSFYVFPQYKLEKDEESRTVYVTAKPIDKNIDPNVLLCMNPVEVPLTIRNVAPVMLHGLGMTYPESMLDVPLRVGLKQIQGAQADIKPENLGDIPSLWLPLRKVAPVTGSVTNLVMSDVEKAPYVRMPDRYIYLVGSNDPNYQSLTPVGAGDDKNVFNGLLEVGRILEISAKKLDNYSYENYVRVVFDENFKPREGYYYMIRYSFQEDQSQVSDNEYIGEEAPCYGEDIFTIKIVPEYQVWTGAKDADYNNDSNWRRVSADNLLAAANANGLDGLVIDDTNANIKSYVPMDFTKVIIPDAKDLTDQGYIDFDDEIDIDPLPTDMEAGDGRVLALEKLDGVGPFEVLSVLGKDNYLPGTNNQFTFEQRESAYTGDIRYDMASYLDNNGNIQCKLWYHNTCEQIHFNFGSEMLRQGELRYEKAWLDLDNKPGSWYFLSLPLKDVYAGEFYLPKADAVDKSQLFTDIYYRTQTHDRFRPAVYQRGWNKGQATIYRPDGTTDNAAAKTTTEWSRVYNEVLERYDMSSNPGFSIRTDLSFMEGNTDDINSVRFRLPKADVKWSYRTMENGTSNNIAGTITAGVIDNERVVSDVLPYHKLNGSFGQMNATVERPSEYFLVGNPFVCHLDLKEFFDKNDTDIESQCWILNDGQLISIVPEMYANEAGKAWRYLPPFQGFFVKKKGGVAKELEVSFTEGMMASMMTDNIMTLGNRPVVATDNSLLITMSAPGESDSHIRIMLGEGDADAPALFNADSENGMTAYSVSDGLATSVKYVDEIKKEEVGVAVKGDAEVKIRFNGDCLDGLMLHDNLTGEVIELYDGMEYTVNGTASGRLYITSGIEDPAIVLEDFRVEVSEGKVAVIAPGEVETLLLQVFDTEGHLISNSLSDSNRAEAELETGIYILKAVTDAGSNFTAKVRM